MLYFCILLSVLLLLFIFVYVFEVCYDNICRCTRIYNIYNFSHSIYQFLSHIIRNFYFYFFIFYIIAFYNIKPSFHPLTTAL